MFKVNFWFTGNICLNNAEVVEYQLSPPLANGLRAGCLKVANRAELKNLPLRSGPHFTHDGVLHTLTPVDADTQGDGHYFTFSLIGQSAKPAA